MKKLNIKDEEKLFVTKYMEFNHNYVPNFIETNTDILDCYFQYNNKYYAVEVTRYFQQNSEKKHLEDINNIEKFMKKRNFFQEVYQRLGKRDLDDLTISFYDKDEMTSMIMNNMQYVKNISVGNNYYFNNLVGSSNDAFCIGNGKERMTIEEFFDLNKDNILNEMHIEIDIKTKNNKEISIAFKYCKHKYYGNDNNKKVIPCFCWWENSNELYDNIVNSIIKKNNKLINEYTKILNLNNIKFDFYNLVIYSEGIPAELDEEKLFNIIINIPNLSYDEIAIFLWKKLMIINKNGYNIISTN